MNSLPPVLIMLAAAGLVMLLPKHGRRALAIAAPVLVFIQLFWVLDPGDGLSFRWLSLDLQPLRVDRLSLVFGYVFAIAAALGGLYAWHLNDRLQQAAALTYAGGSLGVVLAGDLLTLVAFWELMALASAYLVWSGSSERSRRAAVRYLFVHVTGGTVLLAGMLWHLGGGGGLEFTVFESGPAAWLVLIGFVINAAVPPLHAWLPDAYPEASITGSVFLSAFTTKTAVYVLARGFPGWDLLVPAGAFMAVYGIVFALLQNDVRRILAYEIISQVGYMVAAIGIGTESAISQVGYMVAAIGIGTESAINGAAAHAFAHVLYKGLLFMAVGALIFATGRRLLTDLGGMGRLMPAVVALYMIGALSIAAFPLFSGFTTKSMVIFAAEESGMPWVVFFLYAASVGTFLVTGLKLPYLMWSGPRRDDAQAAPVPRAMIAAMSLAALLCVAIGAYPALLYDRLPFPIDYDPYTASHVIWTLQYLGFTAIGFWLLIPRLGGEPTVTLDTDWLYRKAGKPAYILVQRPLEAVFTAAERATATVAASVTAVMVQPERAAAGLLRLMGVARGVPPEKAYHLLARPPVGYTVAVLLLTFAAVAIIASATRP